MAFGVPCAVLTLPVGHVRGLVLDGGSRRSGTGEVGVNVVDLDDEPGAGRVHGARGGEPVLSRDTVQPDRTITRVDLAVDLTAVVVAIDSSGPEPERLDEEVVGGLDVVVHEYGHDTLNGGHDLNVAPHQGPGYKCRMDSVSVPPSPPRRPLLRELSDISWRALVIAAAALALVYLLVRLRLVVLPVFIAALLATALIPPVRALERRRWPPALATWAVFLGFLGVLVGIGSLIVPPIVDEFAGLGETVSEGIDDVERWLIEGPFDLSRDDIRRYRQDGAERIDALLSDSSGSILAGTVAVVEGLAGLLLALVVTFFVVKDGPLIQRWVLAHLPARQHEGVRAAADRAWRALGAYLRGAALIGFLEAIIIGVTLAVVGAPLAAPVAVLTFFGAFFPIVGAVVAGIIAFLVALVGGGLADAIAVGIVALIVQQLDNDLLAPVIYGRIIRLHPLVVLLSLAAGATLAGIAGAFLAVPTTAVAVAIGGEAWRRRTEEAGVDDAAVSRR